MSDKAIGKNIGSLIKNQRFWSGPLLFLIMLLSGHLIFEESTSVFMAGIILWMAAWWILQVVPLGITALIPMIAYPTLGLMSSSDTAMYYMNHIIFLFVGGFLVAFAMEKWNLHKRLALGIIKKVGFSPPGILFGFMIAGFLLSMWISNSATAIMLIAPALALITQLEEVAGKGNIQKFAIGLLLGIAYACSVGGAATPVGSPPNLIFLGFYGDAFPDASEITFARWFMFGFPLSLTLFALVYALLYFQFGRVALKDYLKQVLSSDSFDLKGKMSREEKIVLWAFISLAFLWFLRADIDLGFVTLPGWTNILPNGDYITDGSIAVFVAVILFLIPGSDKKKGNILTLEEVKRIPFDVILLFGGGFALAGGFSESGLADELANYLSGVEQLPVILLVVVICLVMIFLTELSSNTATVQLILPVLIVITQTTAIDPYILLIPATIAASYAFMLPVATPPNTIIFGSERIKVMDMAKTGFFLNLLAVVLLTAFIFLFGETIFGEKF